MSACPWQLQRAEHQLRSLSVFNNGTRLCLRLLHSQRSFAHCLSALLLVAVWYRYNISSHQTDMPFNLMWCRFKARTGQDGGGRGNHHFTALGTAVAKLLNCLVRGQLTTTTKHCQNANHKCVVSFVLLVHVMTKS